VTARRARLRREGTYMLTIQRDVELLDLKAPIGRMEAPALLLSPSEPRGLVVFAHCRRQTLNSVRSQYLAFMLSRAGYAAFLPDLMAADETADESSGRPETLAERLAHATAWIRGQPQTVGLPLGYFAAGTGAGAALHCAVGDDHVRAIVCRSAYADPSDRALARVHAPTLLIVGQQDKAGLNLNRETFAGMNCLHELVVVPDAGPSFEEAGALEQVALLSRAWFERYLRAADAERLP
jgi:alpha-beta hydrolase superfamily lysophospholipase